MAQSSTPAQPPWEKPRRAIGRRSLVAGAAWVAPAVSLASPAPALAASGVYQLTVVTPGLSDNGADLYLCDRKANNPNNNNPNTSPTGQQVLFLTVKVTDNGLAAPNVTVSFSGDNTKDGEGNYMIAFWDVGVLTGMGESSTKRTASASSDADGLVTVKVSTATFGQVDCGSMPKQGSVTMSAGAPQVVLSYTIYDCSPLVANCP